MAKTLKTRYLHTYWAQPQDEDHSSSLAQGFKKQQQEWDSRETLFKYLEIILMPGQCVITLTCLLLHIHSLLET